MTQTLAFRLPAGWMPTYASVDPYNSLGIKDSLTRDLDCAVRVDYCGYLEGIAQGAGYSIMVLGNGEVLAEVEQAGDVALWWEQSGREIMGLWEPAPDTWDQIDDLWDGGR